MFQNNYFLFFLPRASTYDYHLVHIAIPIGGNISVALDGLLVRFCIHAGLPPRHGWVNYSIS